VPTCLLEAPRVEGCKALRVRLLASGRFALPRPCNLREQLLHERQLLLGGSHLRTLGQLRGPLGGSRIQRREPGIHPCYPRERLILRGGQEGALGFLEASQGVETSAPVELPRGGLGCILCLARGVEGLQRLRRASGTETRQPGEVERRAGAGRLRGLQCQVVKEAWNRNERRLL
jgi:hypothetical protein